MKGDIKVTSKEGRGSSFILAFPAEVCQEISAFSGSYEGLRDPKLFQGKTCLLLDDIPENTYLMKEFLHNYGLSAICSQSGFEALDIYKRAPKIDIIVTDLRMPEMSGQTFILEIRKFEAENRRLPVPIVVVTAESAVDEKALCLTKYGANEYLIKPIKYQELITTLIKVCSDSPKECKKNILVIDDDQLSARILSSVLKHSGHGCHCCNSIGEVCCLILTRIGEKKIC